MNTASALGYLVYGQGDACMSVSIMLTWRLLQVQVVWSWLLCGMEKISLCVMLPWILLPVHTEVLWAYLSRLPYGYFRETHWISMGLLEITMVTLTCMYGAATGRSHGPPWRTSATFGARNPCRLFQKSIPAARHGRPSTDFWNNRCKEPVPFVSKIHPGSPSRTSVHRLLKQSVQGIGAVCFKSPSRRPVLLTSVTARSHELLKQTAPHTPATLAPGPALLIQSLL